MIEIQLKYLILIIAGSFVLGTFVAIYIMKKKYYSRIRAMASEVDEIKAFLRKELQISCPYCDKPIHIGSLSNWEE